MSVRTEPFLAAQDDEEAAKEKPAKKQTREEDVFAGNKNLRSDDQKFREMHDDRLTCHTLVIACKHLIIHSGRLVPWMTCSMTYTPKRGLCIPAPKQALAASMIALQKKICRENQAA